MSGLIDFSVVSIIRSMYLFFALNDVFAINNIETGIVQTHGLQYFIQLVLIHTHRLNDNEVLFVFYVLNF